MKLDFVGGLVAVLVAGGANLILIWLPMVFMTVTRKEPRWLKWWVVAMKGLTANNSNLVAGFFTGLLLGQPLVGLAVGAVIELMFLGVFVVGASIPPQPFLSTVLTTVFVIRADLAPEEALALVLPIAIFAQLSIMIALSYNHIFLGMAKKKAEEGDAPAIDRLNTWPQAVGYGYLGNILPAFIGGFFGVGLVQSAVTWLQTNAGWVLGAFGYLAGFLPALGFALLLYQMGTRLIGYLILGIIAALYLKPDTLAVAVAGVGLALIHMLLTRRDEAAPVAAEAAAERPERELHVTESDLESMYWRHTNIFSVASWEVLGGLGFGQVMVPVIERLYKTKEDISAALKRHIVFYNTNLQIGSIIPGVLASMEEEKANGQPVDEAAIQGVKVGMMGPFAGVGDSLHHATWQPIMRAIAAAWAQSGSVALQWLAPIFLIVLGGFVPLYVAWLLLKFGYRRGLAALQDLQQRNLLADLSTAATVVGQFVIGALVITLVSAPIRWAPSFFGTSPIKIQEILDSIMPSLVPLLVFFFCYWLLRKGKSAIYVMVVLLVIALVGSYPIPLPIFNNSSILGQPIAEEAAESLLLLRSTFGV